MNADKVYGRNYYAAGRYNYIAIDSTVDNSSGSSTLISGILPQKLGRQFANCVNTVQSETLESHTLALLVGDSANSIELHLYTVSDGEIYKKYRAPLIEQAREYFSAYGIEFNKWKLYEVESLMRQCVSMFQYAAEQYEKEFKKPNADGEWYNLTALDCHICALQYIQFLQGEYKINKLS